MKLKIFIQTIAIMALTIMPLTTWSAQKKGVTLADEATEQGHSLKLNGLGVRKAFGVVSVYVGGLYLEKLTHSAEEILAAKDTKKLVLHFVIDVEKEKITEAWSEGFKKNCKVDCAKYDAEMKSLNGWMANMRTNEELIFTLAPDTVTVTVKGVEKGALKKENFPQQFLAIFLGPQPPNKALKDGLLGLDP